MAKRDTFFIADSVPPVSYFQAMPTKKPQKVLDQFVDAPRASRSA